MLHGSPPPRSFTPATQGATVALIALLGALALLLLGCSLIFNPNSQADCPPGEIVLDENGSRVCAVRAANHYTCQCQCTRGFSAGGRIATAKQTRVRETPAGRAVGTVPVDFEGVVVAGPVQAVLNGEDETWVQVEFDAFDDGWVLQRDLVAIGTDPLIVKPLDVCLPPVLNANLEGGHEPTPDEVGGDCSTDRVAPAFATLTGQQLPAGSECTCQASTFPDTWDASCDTGCADPSGVCLLAGSDPPEPTPDPLAATLFGATSVCEVLEGEARIHLDDRVFTTPARGLVQLHGRPCRPGESCQVGLAYQMTFDDFSIPVRFHKDPRFVELSLSGASEPGALALGPFLFDELHAGALPANSTLNSGRGRRSGSSRHVVVVGQNVGPLEVAVDWVNKHCVIDGDFLGQVQDDDDTAVDVRIVVTAGGLDDARSRLVNQPPRADAGPDQTVECTSPAGALVTLDAAGSTDADDNIALYAWRQGSETGPLLATPSADPSIAVAQAIGEATYALGVVDGRLAVDSDTVAVRVADTIAPDIACNAPATITPPGAPVAFRATAGDFCGSPPAVLLDDAQCFKAKVDGLHPDTSCKVELTGDTITIRNTGGVNRVIRWTALAADAAGNVGQRTCEVTVANPGSGP